MAQITFSPGTVITKEWLNDIDQIRFGVNDPLKGSALIQYIQFGTGAISWFVQDKLRGLEVDIEDFGINTVPGTTDCSAFLQLAINKVALAGGGTVKCMNPPYKIAAASGSTVTLPASGATMPYCVQLKNKVKIKGPGRDRVTFVGDWIMRTTVVDTTQKIMFRLFDASGDNFYFEDCGFSNSMLTIYHAGIISGYMKDCAFTNCGLPFISQQAERFVWDGVDFGGSGAGVMVGGWLTGTPGAGGVNGGWMDKCILRRFSYIRFDAGWTASEIALDTFFNTHFFANGTNGLTNAVPNYRGVVGILAFVVGRYDAPSHTNEFDTFFSFGSPRPMIFGGPEYLWHVKNLNAEKVGYTDSTVTTRMSSANDTWMSNANYPFSANLTRLRALVDVYVNSGVSKFEEIQATTLSATDIVAPIQMNRHGLFAPSTANPDLTNTVPGASLGEALILSYANPDISAIQIRATTATSAAGMLFNNGGGNVFVGADNSVGGRITGAAYGGYLWLDYSAPIVFGIANLEVGRFVIGGGGFKSTGGFVGTATNDNAAVGLIGESVSSTVAALATGLTSGAPLNVTSISLTAGDWDVWGSLIFSGVAATTSFTVTQGGVSSVSATLPATNLQTFFTTAAFVPATATYQAYTLPPQRLSLAGTTTIYLVAQATFTASTAGAGGVLSARRRR